jgi:hypothetical protein
MVGGAIHHRLSSPSKKIISSNSKPPNQLPNLNMTKFLALVATAAALIASVQAAGCPPNRRLCGHTLIDDYQCKPLTLSFKPPRSPVEQDGC